MFSKCKLDGLALNTFVEKFYGCYRNGLDGGRDMRSFAGLYFIVRPMSFIAGSIASTVMISNNDPYLPRSVIFIAASLVIALCRPYKKMYMNVLDCLLLAHLGILCHLISSYPGFQRTENFVYASLAMIALPFVCFVLFFIHRAVRKIVKSRGFKHFFGKCKVYFSTNEKSEHNDSFIGRPLIDSTSASYGTVKNEC